MSDAIWKAIISSRNYELTETLYWIIKKNDLATELRSNSYRGGIAENTMIIIYYAKNLFIHSFIIE